MNHTEKELEKLKKDITKMWKLVLSQLQKSQQALFYNDLKLAQEIIEQEHKVNARELKLDHHTENYIALFSPVAIDLRLALSLIKISSSLERVGDYALSIAHQVMDGTCKEVNPQLLEDLALEEIYHIVIGMLSDSFVTLESGNTKMSKRIISRDKEVDFLYKNAFTTLTKYLEQHPDQIRCGLDMLLVLRKLERTGDQCTNIVEEIVFYMDAVVLKHKDIKDTTN